MEGRFRFPSDGSWTATTLEEWKYWMAKSRDSVVFVKFSASWCGPCRVVAPLFEELAKKNPRVVFLKVDVDDAEEIAALENVTTMPTVRVYRNGRSLGEVKGASKSEIIGLVEAYA